MKSNIILILLVFLVSSVTLANGRVVEVENYIRLNTQEYMRASYPNTKFSVEVKVNPRRVKTASSEKDVLPFFSSTTTESLDFWDDPNKTVFQLMGKIRSVKLKINFLDDIEISNRDLFKERILRSIGLIPGRDSVDIYIEPKNLLNKSLSNIVLSEKNIGFMIIAFSLLFVCIVAFISFNKFLRIKVDSQTGKSVSSGENDIQGPSVMPSRLTQANLDKGSSMEKISFSDPTSSLGMIQSKILEISKSGTFPNLRDMLTFDKLINENPRSFSYLIFEFSQKDQDLVFKKGKNEKWYTAFSNAGELDRDIFYILDTMLRNRDYCENEKFESLIIQCWRMGDKLAGFLKDIDRKDSLSILSYLPKYISVPIAREIFPGAWGDVLAEKTNNNQMDTARVEKYMQHSIGLYPELDKRSLSLFRDRKDLLSYLKMCEVVEEEEVYKVLGEDSAFYNVRPPFYKFFQIDDEIKRVIFEAFSLSEWAIMNFNISRDYRKKMNIILSEKERYLLGIHLKALDSNPPKLSVRGELRESVGRVIHEQYISNDNVRSIHEETAA